MKYNGYDDYNDRDDYEEKYWDATHASRLSLINGKVIAFWLCTTLLWTAIYFIASSDSTELSVIGLILVLIVAMILGPFMELASGPVLGSIIIYGLIGVSIFGPLYAGIKGRSSILIALSGFFLISTIGFGVFSSLALTALQESAPH